MTPRQVKEDIEYAKFLSNIFFSRNWLRRHPILAAVGGTFLGAAIVLGVLLVLAVAFPPFGAALLGALAVAGAASLAVFGIKTALIAGAAGVSALFAAGVGVAVFAAIGAFFMTIVAWAAEGIRRLKAPAPMHQLPESTTEIFRDIGVKEVTVRACEALIAITPGQEQAQAHLRSPKEQLVFEVREKFFEECRAIGVFDAAPVADEKHEARKQIARAFLTYLDGLNKDNDSTISSLIDNIQNAAIQQFEKQVAALRAVPTTMKVRIEPDDPHSEMRDEPTTTYVGKRHALEDVFVKIANKLHDVGYDHSDFKSKLDVQLTELDAKLARNPGLRQG